MSFRGTGPGKPASLRWICCLLPWLVVACGGDSPAPGASPVAGNEAARGATDLGAEESGETEMPKSDADGPLVVFLGDSLTAGYGLDENQAYPALVEAELEARGRTIRVVNAGVSGDTTAGGLRRLDWLLRQQPDLLVVALGGNDGLRGVDLETSEANLREIVRRAQSKGIEVLLAGMLIPPNYGEDYTRQFAEIYPRLQEELEVARIPFLLDGVAARPELNLPDGIHPNAEGQQLVSRTVLEHLLPLLDDLQGS